MMVVLIGVAVVLFVFLVIVVATLSYANAMHRREIAAEMQAEARDNPRTALMQERETLLMVVRNNCESNTFRESAMKRVREVDADLIALEAKSWVRKE